MTSTWTPASAAEAAGVMVTCAQYLAGHDYAGLDAEELVRVITAMEKVDSGQAVTWGKSLTQFDRLQAYTADGYRAAGPWLEYRNGIDKATAKAHRAWMKRLDDHPVVMAAMESLAMADCIARRICKLTGKLPAEETD
ncbi:MAG TPA: hypothetical protein VH307_28290, partial [Streptosporangiaceae bacterium]|nr:hypothetical protein [Streptosporangiaceae bacterium]